MDNTRLILEMFLKTFEKRYSLFEDIYNNFQPEFIKNPDRKWYQFWKDRLITNPDYDPTPRTIRIKRPAGRQELNE